MSLMEKPKMLSLWPRKESASTRERERVLGAILNRFCYNKKITLVSNVRYTNLNLLRKGLPASIPIYKKVSSDVHS